MRLTSNTSLNMVMKRTISASAKNQMLGIQPTVSHFTDWAILAHESIFNIKYNVEKTYNFTLFLNHGRGSGFLPTKKQYPGASQTKFANYFSLLWCKPISWHCIGDILIKKLQFTVTSTLMPILVVDNMWPSNRVCLYITYVFSQ